MENEKFKLRPEQAHQYISYQVEYNIRKDNQQLVERLCSIEKVKSSRVNSSQSKSRCKFTVINQNLRSMASITRCIKSRQIENENAKIFNRLIHTNPTLSRQDWMKSIKNNKQYKMNMSRTKCIIFLTQTHNLTTRMKFQEALKPGRPHTST